jgi:hypothetical protein
MGLGRTRPSTAMSWWPARRRRTHDRQRLPQKKGVQGRGGSPTGDERVTGGPCRHLDELATKQMRCESRSGRQRSPRAGLPGPAVRAVPNRPHRRRELPTCRLPAEDTPGGLPCLNGVEDDGWEAAGVIVRNLSESWVLLRREAIGRPSRRAPRRFQEAFVPYGVDSSDGMASPAGSDARQRSQAFRKSNPPSGPSATGIPSMR